MLPPTPKYFYIKYGESDLQYLRKIDYLVITNVDHSFKGALYSILNFLQNNIFH